MVKIWKACQKELQETLLTIHNPFIEEMMLSSQTAQ